MKIEIVESLKTICLNYEQKQNRGSSFRPFRYNKYKDGSNSPVFFIGSPGVSVAIYSTVLIAVTFYLFSVPFKWWAWAIYILLGAFFMKVAFKMDKIKQIRSLALAQALSALKILEILNNEEKTVSQISELLTKSKDFLTEASVRLDEPLIIEQLEIVNRELDKIKAP